MKLDRRWRRVVFGAECDEAGNCPICKTIDFAECPHPGPTQDDKYEYRTTPYGLQARHRRPDTVTAHASTKTASATRQRAR